MRFLRLICAPLVLAACGGGNSGSKGDAGPADGAVMVDDAGQILDAAPVDAAIQTGPLVDAGRPTPLGDVLEHHGNARRTGLYLDPAFTRTASAALHRDATFVTTMAGPTYAQPLYFVGGPGGKDLVIVATEQNQVTAFDAADGTVVWQRNQLVAPVPLANLPCGNIDPLGITGTPVIDRASRTLYLDAMTTNGGTQEHQIFALSVDTGATLAGWPTHTNTVSFTPPGKPAIPFASRFQNQRGALTVLNGKVYVPYGGHYGDCGTYHGWLLGVPMDTPAAPVGWATRAVEAGAWAPGGVSSDGTNLYLATGNSGGTNTWADGEAVIRLQQGPSYTQQPTDYFSPSNWLALDSGDIDIGSTSPVLFDVAGAAPGRLTMALGKNGHIYLINRDNLGGMTPVDTITVANGTIITAAASYATPMGAYVVFQRNGSTSLACPTGQTGDLMAVKISAASPPKLSVAWCARENGAGAPVVTATEGSGADAVVWAVGAGGDNKLHGFDGDTGAVVFAGGGAMEQMTKVQGFQTPMVSGGRIFVAAENQVYAFTVR